MCSLSFVVVIAVVLGLIVIIVDIGRVVLHHHFSKTNIRLTNQWIRIITSSNRMLREHHLRAIDQSNTGADAVQLTDATIHGAVALWFVSRLQALLVYGSIEDWDVSNVTNMTRLFWNFKHFNDDLSRWDVSHVTTMSEMFEEASSFNQSLDAWDVSSVTTMSSMFDGAFAFNQPLQSWNVSRVASARYVVYV